jgi:CheY-like chemotaxis protein
VVILDLRMPGMDGFEVCRRIKGDPQTRHATVIAMTAFFSPGAEREILECGAAACLTEPLEIDVMLQQMERALARYAGPRGQPGQAKVNRRADNRDLRSPDQSPSAIVQP